MSHMPETISYLEVLWTVIGAIPFFLGSLLLRSLMHDRKVLKEDGVNGADDIVIATWIGLVWFEMVSTGAIVGTGVTAMLIPASTSQAVTATGAAITVGFLVIGCASAGVMFWVIVRRLKLRLFLESKYRVEHISLIHVAAAAQQQQEYRVDAP